MIKELLKLKINIDGIDCSKESWRGLDPFPEPYFTDEFDVICDMYSSKVISYPKFFNPLNLKAKDLWKAKLDKSTLNQ